MHFTNQQTSAAETIRKRDDCCNLQTPSKVLEAIPTLDYSITNYASYTKRQQRAFKLYPTANTIQ